MGQVNQATPATPFVALLFGREGDYEPMLTALEENLFGERERESESWPFEATRYYHPSMGEGLIRRLVTFRRLADPGELASWKHLSNALEARFAKYAESSGGPLRPVNIDVGYLTGAKLVLASTKDFAHRIYLRDGIFAEITLFYRKQKWEHHDYTFPDFRSGLYFPFLSLARDQHLRKIRNSSE